MPKRKKESSLFTYVLVVVILTVALIFIAPTQIKQFVDAVYIIFENLSLFGQAIIVLIIIALIVYLLKRLGKL